MSGVLQQPATAPPRGPRSRTATGLRTVAAFEAGKGVLVLAAGLGLPALAHHGLQAAAEAVVRHLHLNPANHLPAVFLELAADVGERDLWLLAAGAVAYAALRLAEGYGLWRDRVWATWLGALSGAVYLPLEVREAVERPGVLSAGVLVVNLGIVGFLAWRLWRRHTAGR